MRELLLGRERLRGCLHELRSPLLSHARGGAWGRQPGGDVAQTLQRIEAARLDTLIPTHVLKLSRLAGCCSADTLNRLTSWGLVDQVARVTAEGQGRNVQ